MQIRSLIQTEKTERRLRDAAGYGIRFCYLISTLTVGIRLTAEFLCAGWQGTWYGAEYGERVFFAGSSLAWQFVFAGAAAVTAAWQVRKVLWMRELGYALCSSNRWRDAVWIAGLAVGMLGAWGFRDIVCVMGYFLAADVCLFPAGLALALVLTWYDRAKL